MEQELNLSYAQKNKIFFSYLLEETKLLFLSILSETDSFSVPHGRGNTQHRQGGQLSEDEHNAYLDGVFLDYEARSED